MQVKKRKRDARKLGRRAKGLALRSHETRHALTFCGLRMTKPSLTSLRMFWRELAIEISLICEHMGWKWLAFFFLRSFPIVQETLKKGRGRKKRVKAKPAEMSSGVLGRSSSTSTTAPDSVSDNPIIYDKRIHATPRQDGAADPRARWSD